MTNRLEMQKLLYCTLFLFSISNANPLLTTPFSEIQIKDQSHFTIEFDGSMVMSKPYPAHMDSIFLFCGGDMRPPLDSMKKCEKTIDLDTNGVALITEKDFPGFLIRQGKLYFGCKSSNYFPPLQVTSSSYSKTFVSGYSDPVCCGEYINGKCMTCRSLIYKETKCPSLGIRNYDATIIISGHIIDYSDNIPDTIRIIYTNDMSVQTNTTVGGYFNFSMTNCFESINLKFCDKTGSEVKDTTIGPFQNGARVSLSIKVPVTSSKIPKKSDTKLSIARILSAAVRKGIVFSLSETAASQGVVQIYSNNGKLIKKLPFASHGAGTYTVNWNGKNEHNRNVPSGIYTVRILIGKESLCSGILNL
jgi:hypothetical protein